ncbi:asparaginase-domain-containing protein [Testicularia cyperi]|uniref:asparaginase n=1 Tax=Testicularia cyperi TaxID=1882483 RepID=A0A317XSH8_9BASI|nr:asparaginase-domain-containing protein [Testicularia cyperi]
MSSSGEALVLCLYAGGTIGMVRKDASSGFAPYPSFLTETLRSQSRFHDPHGDSIFSWSDSVDRYKAWSEAYTRPGSGASTPLHPSSASNSTGEAPTNSMPSGASIAKAVEAKTNVSLQVQNNRDAEAAKSQHQQLQHKKRKAENEANSGRLTPSTQAHLEHLYADSSAATRSMSLLGGAGAGPGAGGAAPNGGAPPFGHPVTVRSSAPKGTSTHHAISSNLSPDGTHLELQLPTLITPRAGAHGKRVRYAVLEYDPLLDSSEMDIPDWIRLASDISLNYQQFDSFIVLHGTDTMAYTASALSMLLENLGKSVIVTGAQVPLSELRNDAIENVLGALMLAGSYIIPEVGLYFASTLYRGNRTSKVSNNALAAFDSPNMAPLARVGIHIDVAWNLVERSKSVRAFRAHDRMSPNVAVLRLFPGLPTSTVKSFLSPPLEGVILESYGAGNAPSRPDLLEVFKQASDRGLVIVNITQCVQGEVSAIYAVGKKLEAVGVVAGGDMTPECALAKLSYLLAKGLQPAEVRQLMARPLRGELTSSRASTSTLSLPRELTPASGPVKADLTSLLAHILQDPSKATLPPPPSHSSSSSSSSSMTRVGASTEAEPDSANETAAAAWDRSSQEVTSASLAVLPYLIYDAASKNDVVLLRWHLSALMAMETVPSISISDEHFHPATSDSVGGGGGGGGSGSGKPTPTTTREGPLQTTRMEQLQPLHIACCRGFTSIVHVLLEAGCSVHARDATSGHTPLYLAAYHHHPQTVSLLRNAGAHLKDDESRLARFLLSSSSSFSSAAASATTPQNSDAKAIWCLAGLEIDDL